MSRESYDALEKRIKELEEEVKKMKEPIESTLMDIRQLISELENPFNYIAKLIDLDKIPAEKIAVNKEQTGNILQRDHEWKSRDNEYREVMVREPRESYREIKKTGQGYLVEPHLLNYLSCACILVKLLGHEYTVRFLNSRIVNKIAPRDVLDSLLDAVEFLSKYLGSQMYLQSNVKLSLDSIITAAYLVSLLATKNIDDRLFILLMLGLKESLQNYGGGGVP
ncbi:MAG: hypothetical protein L4877_03215 [Aigarchaeota archaeon]|nr:hypothetical protein [Candidatus Geocrenenecus dongiae]